MERVISTNLAKKSYGKMNRFLLDLQNLDWQIQDIANETPLRGDYQRFHTTELLETPLRGDYPRFRRTELLDDAKSVPRKYPLWSTPQDAINDDPEQCNVQKFRCPNCIKIKACPLIPKQIYPGDRFIPCRRGYHFDMAHYLLTKDNTVEKNKHIIDICKQIDSLDTTYQRKALRTMAIELPLMPELDQNKILRFSGSMVQPRNLPRGQEHEKGSWKCMPRKRTLIGSADKMLSIFNHFLVLRAIDWSCNDMIAVTDDDCLNIYDNNGEKLSSYKVNLHPNFNKIVNIKWNNNGDKLIMSVFIHGVKISMLVLYDLKENKILWNVDCSCKWISIDRKNCVMRCICWSAHERQIVTGCAGRISVYDSDTGDFLHYNDNHTSNILTLNFSPNFKYLVSTTQDRLVRVYTWPELTSYFNIKFMKPVKAIAWHPHTSDLLCIGNKYGSLSLWNVNKCEMIAFVRAKFNGRVENLAWNKLSGELVVHWTYKEGNNQYTIIAVLASLNRIVDVLPLDNELQFSFLKFNATHEKLITYCISNGSIDSNDICSVWHFFGNKKSFQQQRVPLDCSTQQKQKVLVRNPIR